MKSAVRRTGIYFHSDASRSAPAGARAPNDAAVTGNARRQLMPSGFSSPFSVSVSGTLNSGTPTRVASSPAGAFQTPRCASVRAKIPATAPHGRILDLIFAQRIRLCSRGKKIAA